MTVTTYRIETADGETVTTTAPGVAEWYSQKLNARVTARTEG